MEVGQGEAGRDKSERPSLEGRGARPRGAVGEGASRRKGCARVPEGQAEGRAHLERADLLLRELGAGGTLRPQAFQVLCLRGDELVVGLTRLQRPRYHLLHAHVHAHAHLLLLVMGLVVAIPMEPSRRQPPSAAAPGHGLPYYLSIDTAHKTRRRDPRVPFMLGRRLSALSRCLTQNTERSAAHWPPSWMPTKHCSLAPLRSSSRPRPLAARRHGPAMFGIATGATPFRKDTKGAYLLAVLQFPNGAGCNAYQRRGNVSVAITDI